jgi:pSer/pThr/pTyr-binding forkhead associated (FHA) protein
MEIKIKHKNQSSNNTYLELQSQGKLLHLELTKQQHILGRDRTLVDLVVPEDWQIVGRCQAVLRQEGEDYRIYDGDGQKPSTNGLYIERTRITSESGYSLKNGTEIKIGQNPENLVVLRYCNPSKPVANVTPGWHSISLKNF